MSPIRILRKLCNPGAKILRSIFLFFEANVRLEVVFLPKMISIIACAHNNWRHVWLVNVASGLLFDFDSSTDNHIIPVDEVTLLKELALRRHLSDELGDLYELARDTIRVLHEEAQALAWR